jgi:hypothetical protein
MIRRRQKWVAGLAVAGLMLLTSVAMAQPQGRGNRQGGRGPGMFGGGGGMGKVMLLMRDDVRKHLDLLDEQVEDLQAAAQAAFQGMRNREDREGAMKNLDKTIGEVLLPHQVKRLNQISMQQQMRGGRGLLSEDMVATLKITDAQKGKIEARSEQIRDELNKKIAELRKQYEGKILDELTATQRAKLKEMVGEPFELQQQERGAGFGGFGGGRRPGGEGGQQGGGRAGGRRGG